jgi:competence factor transporting protein
MISINELLFQFIYRYKVTFFFYIAFTALLYPFQNIIIPDYYGKVINSFKEGTKFFVMIKMLFYVFLISMILDYLVGIFQYLIVPDFSQFITTTMFSFILNHYEYDFENVKLGEIISKMTKMPSILFDYVDVFRLDVLKQVFVFIAAIFHYLSISKIILYVFFVYLIIHYLYFFMMCKQFYYYNERVNSFQDKSYEYLNDTMQNMSTVYSLNQQQYEKDRFYSFSFSKYKEMFGASYICYLNNYILWAGINISMYIIINYLLYKTYKEKKITSAALVSSFVITWSILSVYQKAIDSAWNLSEVNGQLFNAQNFLNEISVNKSEKKDVKQFQNGDIIVSNVYHKYGNDFVLENISLKVKKGEKVAFVGQIGCGKSTMVKLMLGYQPLILGDISIGGISIKDISNEKIREEIFYIPQKPKLFNRTIYDNIVYGMDKPPSKEVLTDIMGAYGISFELDRMAGIEGNSLSGGQRQMVWLIRAILRPCSIIIMDEPTSALDPDNKKLINSIIRTFDKTVIIVSHDTIDPMFRKIHF